MQDSSDVRRQRTLERVRFNREAYQRAEEARAERRRRLRTRDGVVDLSEWREAKRAERFARETFGGISWVSSICVALAEDVGFAMEVVLVQDSPTFRRCLPSAVNEIPVRVRGPAGSSGA
jgi:hypothetical protein